MSVAVFDSFDTVGEYGDVEIHQKAQRFVCMSKVRQYLRVMDGQNYFDRLQFHDDRVVDEKIDTVIAVEG
jgi:hypothetical protein